jgi:DNA replication protein DnaC
MSDSSQDPIGILIAGDHVTDEFFYPKEKGSEIANAKENYNFGIQHHYYSIPYSGGASLIAQFLQKLVNPSNYQIGVICDDKKFVTREILKKYPQIRHFNQDTGVECDIKIRVFRGRKFLGVSEIKYQHYDIPKLGFEGIVPNPVRYLIINDIGKGFRENKKKCEQLLDICEKNQISKVFLKQNPPFILTNSDPCYLKILKDAIQKLVIIVNSSDLRFEGANISYRLSWEKTAEDILYQITNNPEFDDLRQCACLIVRIGLEGALVIKRPYDNVKNMKANLYFDPYSMEDSLHENIEGNIQGISIAFLSGFIKNYIFDNPRTEIICENAIKEGLNTARNMWLWGYGQEDTPDRIPNEINVNQIKTAEPEIIPSKMICPSLISCTSSINLENQIDLSSVSLNMKEFKQHHNVNLWTILSKNREKQSIGTIAYTIVREDIRDLKGTEFPIFQIGNLMAVDRSEIENYQSIKNIIKEYLQSDNHKNPLSIAIFGPPGSGKSYGIKEILKNINETDVKFLSFNLSQFTEIKQLTMAFHKIRDQTLLGNFPLVFFDEFDCKFLNEQLGWIKYFLAPMQDGCFFDGENLHPIGRCILVFAGGVFSDYASFEEECKMDKSKDTKGLDFISRLRGYISIIDCNPTNENDEFYKIRRGILLRSILLKMAPQIVNSKKIDIDENVLRAFIKVPSYRHGVRSILALVEMSNLKNKKKFKPSALPPYEQLKLHVDADSFTNLLLRNIHFEESTGLITDFIISKFQHEIEAFYSDKYKYAFNDLTPDQRTDVVHGLKGFVQDIPKLLRDLDYGFVRDDNTFNNLGINEPKLLNYAKNIDNSQSGSILPHQKNIKQKLRLISILPEVMKEAHFRIYPI